MTYARAVAASTPGTLRWVQLLVGIVCMVMIANLQYGWTLFVSPIEQSPRVADRRHPASLQHFCAPETWLTRSRVGSSTVSARSAARS